MRGRFGLLALLLCAWGVGEIVCPVRAHGERLSDFLPQLFGEELVAYVGGNPELGASHFRLSGVAEFRRLNDSLTPQLVLPPFASPSTGFTFNVELGIPERVREALGPAIGEKATTLGKGRLNVGLAYSYLDYTRFKGQSLSHFRFAIPSEATPDTIGVDLDLRILRQVLALSGTLGLMDDLDVGLSVPYIFTSLRADAVANINPPSLLKFPGSPPTSSLAVSKSQSDEGIGDVRLLGKYVFLRDLEWIGNLGIMGEVKFPTGKAGNLTGTGTTQATGTLVVSRDIGWLGPHLNVGFTHDFRDGQNDGLKTLLGFDARLTPHLTLASEVVWRYRTHTGAGANITDFVAGLRWNPYRDLVVTVSAQFPLNKSVGLRTDVTPLLTLEYTF